MQSDQGPNIPDGHDGGEDDEAVWRDLVARLEEPDDAFLEEELDSGSSGGGSSEGGSSGGGSSEGDRHDGGAPGGAAPGGPKTVSDFDPLGVWRNSVEPAPLEPVRDNPAAGHGEGGSWGPRDYAVDDDEGEFVPEEPPSLRGAEPALALAWLGAVGGPIFLVLSAIFWRGIPVVAVVGVVLAFLSGTGYLVYRMPKDRDHDGGDGAVL